QHLQRRGAGEQVLAPHEARLQEERRVERRGERGEEGVGALEGEEPPAERGEERQLQAAEQRGEDERAAEDGARRAQGGGERREQQRVAEVVEALDLDRVLRRDPGEAARDRQVCEAVLVQDRPAPVAGEEEVERGERERQPGEERDRRSAAELSS